jgi:pyruvate/2-oxoglutarate dehydrogenase complex dihydrolipoamide dehydrogenase (E3) component
MKYDYDILVIGLGPAGMAVSIMGSEMGLKVCAIESHKIGGECMNVGCIPSKALLRIAKTRHAVKLFERMQLSETPEPEVKKPFERIQQDLSHISENKTLSMFKKVDLIYQQGKASFVDPHTVAVGDRKVSAKHIFIATGTKPALPPFDGLEDVEPLTNENIFNLDSIPSRLVVLGGGAIACEMAQAFSRLGSKVSIIIRGPRLLRRDDADAVEILEKTFAKEGIEIHRETKPTKLFREGEEVHIETDKGQTIVCDRVLAAAGRRMDFAPLALDKAGVNYKDSGIEVDFALRTSQKHIYAVGDCNGYYQFSHAAMHQGMVALMNCMAPSWMKLNFKKYVVPWTIFTDPQFSHVGPRESELKEQGKRYEVIKVAYEDYGAAIAEAVDVGFVKVYVSPLGRIYAATVVGEGSSDMINEWGLAIQDKIRMHRIMFLQHSFPSMAFLNKRISETWAMKRMKSPLVKAMCKFFFRI